ncbi:hypothetical protein KLP28_15015 [Nocardioidaceae bacterium]|nr:hypothetical protein KLP28_15015 [Nocardioidaceae bacterium]
MVWRSTAVGTAGLVCFSLEADVVAGVALLPVAGLTLREVRHVRELPSASLPLVFALHQLVETLVWAGQDGSVSACVSAAAATTYVFIALPFLPALVPLAILLLEPTGARLRVAPFAALGLVVAGYLAWAMFSGPIDVREEPHALVYGVDLSWGPLWAVLYVVAVVGPCLLSGYPTIIGFGAANLVGLTVVAVLYTQAFASLWCVYAAVTSLLILWHMRRRRRLPDAHRLHGVRTPHADTSV